MLKVLVPAKSQARISLFSTWMGDHFVTPGSNLLSFLFRCSTGHMKGALNETRTHLCRFASRACQPLHHQRYLVTPGTISNMKPICWTKQSLVNKTKSRKCLKNSYSSHAKKHSIRTNHQSWAVFVQHLNGWSLNNSGSHKQSETYLQVLVELSKL